MNVRIRAAGHEERKFGAAFVAEGLFAVLKRWLARPTGASCPSDPTDVKDRDSSAASVGAVLDQKMLDRIRALRRDGAPDPLARIGKMYLETTPDLIETLCSAAHNHDAAEARAAAHTLKSSSANLGAVSLSELCQRLEAWAREGDLHTVREKQDELRTKFRKVEGAIQQELNLAA